MGFAAIIKEEENPGVLKNLYKRYALVRVLLKKFIYQIFVLRRNLRLEDDLLTSLVARNGLLITSVRGVTMYKLV